MKYSYIQPPRLDQNSTENTGRITVEALRTYVPLYQAGHEAEQKFLTEEIKPDELNSLETRLTLKRIALARIVELANPLIIHEIRKLLSNSILSDANEVFDVLYFAGISGLERGLLKFEASKMNKSSTNYLFQWIVTYSKRELLAIEAPFGISPNRYEKYKKIAAVRRKLSAELDRSATNEELLEYFRSGKADMRNKKGKVADSDKPSQANKSITLKIIEEQEELERRIRVELLDPLGDYASDVKLSTNDPTPFSETLFGVFLDSYDFTPESISVLKSELQYDSTTSQDNLASKDLMPEKVYKRHVRLWTDFLQDSRGEFYQFLQTIEQVDFPQVDLRKTIESIKKSPVKNESKHYDLLFESRR